MSTQIGVGVSHNRNPSLAAKEAVALACQQASLDPSSKPLDFVMLFSTVGYRQPVLLKAVRAATLQAPLIGCSGAGIMAQGVADESNFAVTVLVVKSDEMRFVHGLETGIKASSHGVGEAVGEAINQSVKTAEPDSADPQALFLFLEGLTSNFDEFIEGLRSRTDIEQRIPAVGGLSGDDLAMRETFQYCDDEIVTDGVAWALLSGEITVASVMSHGCIPVGELHTVTKSSRNVVQEIDSRSALDVIEGYLTEEETQDWSVAPMMLGWAFSSPTEPNAEAQMLSGESDEMMIRAMASKDDTAGTVCMMSDIVEGSQFRIARRDHEKICNKADRMIDALLAKLNRESNRAPKLIFQVECVARGKLILRESGKLALSNRIQSKMGKEIPWIGFYAFAEIGPMASSSSSAQNCVHNFTSILTAFY